MEKFLKNQQIPLTQVIDPNTGQAYYAPQNVVYQDKNDKGATTLKGVIVESATSSSYALTASYAMNGGGGGSTNTGSLLTTASFTSPNLTFTKGNGSTFNVNISTLTVTSASYALSASFASTASFINPTTTNAFVQGGNIFGAQAILGTNDNQSLALETSGSIRMFISSSGLIGIGKPNPNTTLDISGSVNITGSTLTILSTSPEIQLRGTSTNVGTKGIYFYHSGRTAWVESPNGGSGDSGGLVLGAWGQNVMSVNGNYISPTGVSFGYQIFSPEYNGNGINSGTHYYSFNSGEKALRIASTRLGSFGRQNLKIMLRTALAGSDAGDSDTFFYVPGTNKNISINSATTDLGSQLGIRGSGTTSATTALLVQNVNATNMLSLTDNGALTINTFQTSSTPFTINRTLGTMGNNFNAATMGTLINIQDTVGNSNASKTTLYISTTGASTNNALIVANGAVGFGTSSPGNGFTSTLFTTLSGLRVNYASNYTITARDTTTLFNTTTGGGISFWGDASGQGSGQSSFAGIRGLKANNTYLNSLGNLAFFVQTGSNYINSETTFREVGRFNELGYFGIGTSTPSSSLDVSGSGRFTNGLTVTGSLIAPSITGSLLGTASSAATASYVNTLNQSVTISGSVLVNTSNQTLGQFVGNTNGYSEFSIRNTNTGVSASGDIAVYADTGTTLNNYIDMGINNSGLSNTYFYGGTDFGNALDAYVYNVGGNLRIGNATSQAPFSQSFYLFSNPTATPNITITGSQVAINKTGSLNGTFDISGSTVITGSLNVSGGITGSLLGTSSYATQALSASYYGGSVISASYATTASYALNSYPPAGGEYAVQILSGGALAGSSRFTFNTVTNIVSINGGALLSATGSLLGTASVAISAFTTRTNTNATYYPLFVDSSNGTAAPETLWSSTGNITLNPSLGSVSATSFTGSLLGTASYATQALSASWAPGGGSTFPYTGSARITGSLNVTGSFIAGEYGIVSIDSSNRIMADGSGVTSIDYGTRTLTDSAGPTTLNWDASTNGYAVEVPRSYFKSTPDTSTQENFSAGVFNAEGRIIEGVSFNGASDYNFVYLDNAAGEWRPVNNVSDRASKMLGIAFNVGSNNSVLLEGHVTITNTPGTYNTPAVDVIAHGLPIYVSSSAFATTTVPTATGEYVRILGHAYYQNSGDPDVWVMNFRPDHTWVQL
jgi:hypothetical protein